MQAALFVFPSPTAFGFLRSFTANISSGTVCARGAWSTWGLEAVGGGGRLLVGFGQMYVIIMVHVVNYPYANSTIFFLVFALTCLVSFLLVRFSIKRICEIAWKKYNQNCFQMTYNCFAEW